MARAANYESSPNVSPGLWVPDLRFACPGRQRRVWRQFLCFFLLRLGVTAGGVTGAVAGEFPSCDLLSCNRLS